MKTIEQSHDDCTAAYENYIRAEQRMNQMELDLHNAQIEFENKKNSVLAEYSNTTKHPNGLKDLGSNEENRKAKLAELTVTEANEVKRLEFEVLKAEGDVNITRHRKNLARLQADHVFAANGIRQTVAA